MARIKSKEYKGFIWRSAGCFQTYNKKTGELRSLFSFPQWQQDLIFKL